MRNTGSIQIVPYLEYYRTLSLGDAYIFKATTPRCRRSRFVSGRRGSNPRPSAWEANALPTEPLPHALFALQS